MKKQDFRLKAMTMIFFMLLSGVSFGQGWLRDFIGFSGIDIIQTKDGGFAVAGIDSFANGSLVFKTDCDGVSQWRVKLGIPHYTNASTSIKEMPNGGFIVGSYVNAQLNKADYHLAKLNPFGKVIWERVFDLDSSSNHCTDVQITNDGGFIILGSSYPPGISSQYLAWIVRTDSIGIIKWQKTYDIGTNGYSLRYLIPLPDGGFVFDGGEPTILRKIDGEGNEQWNHSFTGVGRSIKKRQNGGYFFSKGDYSAFGDQLGLFDELGNLVDTIKSPIQIYDAIQSDDGNFVLLGNIYPDATQEKVEISIRKIDLKGLEIWNKSIKIDRPYLRGEAIINCSDGGFAVVTSTYWTANPITLIRLDSLGQVFTNKITGQIHRDPNQNCQKDTLETGLKNWLVQTTNPTGDPFFTTSDSLGNYLLEVGKGSHEVSLTPPNPFWGGPCLAPKTIVFDTTYQTATADFAVQALVDCPLLRVDLTLGAGLRRCFDNFVQVKWLNEGTTTATDAVLTITLDSLLHFGSSEVPPSSQNGQILTFNLGDVAAGDGGDFWLKVLPDCNSSMLNQTLCINAHVTPDSACSVPTSQPLLTVEAHCEGDSLVFSIQNIGGPMSTPLEYVVIEDNIMLFQSPLPPLAAGQIFTVKLPANGSTWRLETLQSPGVPSWLSAPTVAAVVEGCTQAGSFSMGFVNNFSLTDVSPFDETECRPVVSSFDPNLKTGFPTGYAAEHFIGQNTDLEFQIDFQNTGNDTAFTVVLRDTLDGSLLDVSRLQMGAASHPFDWQILGEGVLKIRFKNILLPDSTTNEAASHGFVKFRIPQKTDLPLGSVIRNRAAIFFDFNPPIFTNQTFHTISKPILLESWQPVLPLGSAISVFPNPTSDVVFFEMKKSVENAVLTLTDETGRLVFSKKMSGSPLEIRRDELPSDGLFFAKMEASGVVLGVAKLVVR